MSTLLLRFMAPMQSWGISAKFDSRSTERVPSKSAVIGMIAGALGRLRNESLDDLAVLRFGVRVDNEVRLLRDFQTAKNPNVKTSVYGKPGVYRDYLADAAFLVGLEGDDELLKMIENAIKHPVFPIFLGRRSCPPEGRVLLGIRNAGLMDALKAEPWLCNVNEREQFGKKSGDSKNKVTLRTATFEGELTVTEADAFKKALIEGIGREKAYGCGLLTIIRVR